MKIKTMLRFLLCFLIIVNTFGVAPGVAAPASVITPTAGSDASGTGPTCLSCGGSVDKSAMKCSGGYAVAYHDQRRGAGYKHIEMSGGTVVCGTCSKTVDVGTGKCNSGEAVYFKDGKYYHVDSAITGVYSFGNAPPSADGFFEKGKWGVESSFNVIDSKLSPVMHIQSLIMTIGTVAAVIIVGIYAIQWMIATPSKRQELKSSLFPLIIGVILLFVGPRLTIIIINALMG